jgi:integrase
LPYRLLPERDARANRSQEAADITTALLTVAGEIRDLREVLLAWAARNGQTAPMSPAPTVQGVTRPVQTPAARDSALVERYALERASDCSPQHIREVRGLIRDLLEHAGLDDPGKITRAQVIDFLHYCETFGRAHRLADGTITKRRRKASAKSRRNYLSAMRAFFDWMIQAQEIVMTNPCENVRSPRVHRKQGRAFTAKEAAALIAAAAPERSVLYQLLYVGGPRVGAIAGTPDKPALPDFCFHIEVDPPHVEIPPEFSKTGAGYTIALDEHTARRIRELRAAKGPEHAPGLPLFKRPTRKQFLADCKRAGVAIKDERGRGAGLHCFRRGTATATMNLGFDPKVAQLQLGHADIATTLESYTDRALGDQAEAARALSASLRSSIPRGIQDGADADGPTPPRTGRSGAVQGKSLDRSTAVTDTLGALRPMVTFQTPSRSPEPRRAAPQGRNASSGGLRPGSGDQVDSDRMGSAKMSKWAIQDSNLYHPGDVPPRKAVIMNRLIDIAENLLIRPDSEESDRVESESPQCL